MKLERLREKREKIISPKEETKSKAKFFRFYGLDHLWEREEGLEHGAEKKRIVLDHLARTISSLIKNTSVPSLL